MIRKAIICCLALWSTAALAQNEMGAYLGGGLGQFDYSEEDDELALALEDTTLSYKLYGGYRFNETWALEGSYGETDDLTWSDSEFIPGIGTLSFTIRGDYEILEVRGMAHLKAFFAGIGYWESDLSVNVTVSAPMTGPFSASDSASDSGLSVILGGQWDLERVGVRVELEAYDADESVEAYNVGLGVHYRF